MVMKSSFDCFVSLDHQMHLFGFALFISSRCVYLFLIIFLIIFFLIRIMLGCALFIMLHLAYSFGRITI